MMDSDSSSNASDSESDTEEVAGAVPSGGELTLLDDGESTLIIQPPYLGEAAGEGYGDEGEGEGERDAPGVGPLALPSKSKEGIANAETEDLLKEEEKPKKKKKKRKKLLFVCLTNCKYESVRRVSKRFGFKEIGDDEDWNLFWTDYSVSLERVMDMKKYQKINHFPGMSEICRKDLLARNMNRMLKMFPKDYYVFPRSWCLPADYGDLQSFARLKKHKTYILKPESGCQGKGIWVTKNPKDIKPQEHMLCQQYVSKPFLIDGFKFDLRIYTVVTSCDPLRIFVFGDGLARFATQKYIEPSHNNVSNVFMHLTNYAINKNSSDFIRDDDCGSKRRITTINKWMRDNNYDVDKMWRDIDDVIIKTMISAHPVLKHNYRTCFPNHIRGSACFEILGFDVMVDKRLKPFLVEVNHSPSFHTDAPLDKEIKEALLHDTMNLVNFGAIDKKKCIEEEKRRIRDRLFQKQQKKESKEELDKAQLKWIEELAKYEDSHLGNFRRIYPGEGHEKYEKFFQNSGSLYQETAAFKARSECARQQREEIVRKNEKLNAMKNKKKEARPESPGGRRRQVLRRPNMPVRRLTTKPDIEPPVADLPSKPEKWEYKVHYTLAKSKPYQNLDGAPDGMSEGEPMDTSRPMEIVEEEELERISSLLQRDNLVRGLGIVEHVYRLLHCTPGTTATQVKNHPPGIRHKKFTAASIPAVVGGASSATARQLHMSALHTIYSHNPLPVSHHNLSMSPCPKTAVVELECITNNEGMTETLTVDTEPPHVDPRNEHLPATTVAPHASHQTKDEGRMGQEGHPHLLNSNLYSYNTGSTAAVANNGRPMLHYNQGSTSSQTRDPVTAAALAAAASGIPPAQWKVHRGPQPLLQTNNRTRYGSRKPTFRNLPTVLPESEYYKVASGEVRIPYGFQTTEGRSDSACSSTQRTMSSSPTHKPRDYSGNKLTPRQLAVAQQQGLMVQAGGSSQSLPPYQYSFPNMVKVTQQGPGGLSVVSAPAPVAQRPDMSSAESNGNRNSNAIPQPSALENISGLRPTRSQRIRGAQNNLRMKELELRGNHAVVFS